MANAGDTIIYGQKAIDFAKTVARMLTVDEASIPEVGDEPGYMPGEGCEETLDALIVMAREIFKETT
jgi:hypothetical protein